MRLLAFTDFRRRFTLLALIVTGLVSWTAAAQEPAPSAEALKGAFPAQKSYSPYAGRDFPTRVFWGDTHLHTGMSMDAGAFGARLLPPDAYRFARGEEVTAANGMRVKLAQPLDFLVVADHSDNMGFFPKLFAGDPAYLADPDRQALVRDDPGGRRAGGQGRARSRSTRFSKGTFPPALAVGARHQAYRSAWEDDLSRPPTSSTIPGRFTAFIGYEWTSNTGGNNLHRVVVFRDDAEPRESDRALHHRSARSEATTRRTCGKCSRPTRRRPAARCSPSRTTATSRTGSCSRSIDSFTGQPLTKEYVETRARWEPLYEATQIKGDGEAHPFLSPDDEFADYETWDKFNLNLSVPEGEGHAPVRVRPHGAPDRPAARAEARHQPLQVRHDRLDRQPHRPGDRRRGQLLRQARGNRAQRQALGASGGLLRRQVHPRLGAGGVGVRRRVGHREHARSDLRRHECARRPTPPPGRA